MKAKKAYLFAMAMIIPGVLWTPVQVQSSKIQLVADHDRTDSYRYSWDRDPDPDRIIREAYEDILRREPDYESLRYYRKRMIDDGWTERDVREDLRRNGDYRHGNRLSRREAERIVRDAYQEVLRREPDPGARPWVDKILNEGWTKDDLVRELRNSDEYKRRGRMTRPEAERIVRDAYREVLKRDPDPGSRTWVEKVLREGWTRDDVIRELRNSDEYRNRQRGGVSRQEAEQIVRRAYLAVLEREPDPGSRFWVDKVMNDHWTVEDVARALRDSDEYRRKHR